MSDQEQEIKDSKIVELAKQIYTQRLAGMELWQSHGHLTDGSLSCTITFGSKGFDSRDKMRIEARVAMEAAKAFIEEQYSFFK